MRKPQFSIFLLVAIPALAAEKRFDFGLTPENQSPTGFVSVVTGKGKPGEWKVRLEDEAPILAPLTPQGQSVTKRSVLAQVSRDRTDDHYPLLMYEGETFADFTLSTSFKITDGVAEQMAGLAFRIQDERNYYYVRASALGNTFYFFKFVKGELIGPVGSKVEVKKDVWHDLAIDCRGSQITCSLDGKVIIPQMQQNDFARGKIGFWTKSDSVCSFANTKINYVPIEAPAQAIVRDLLRRYPRLLGLKIYVPGKESGTTRQVAGNNEAENGRPGGKTEHEVITTAQTYYGKEPGSVSVIMPLRDRNGDPIAAARVAMKSFPGQTEENAIVRAAPIVKAIQARVNGLEDLVE